MSEQTSQDNVNQPEGAGERRSSQQYVQQAASEASSAAAPQQPQMAGASSGGEQVERYASVQPQQVPQPPAGQEMSPHQPPEPAYSQAAQPQAAQDAYVQTAPPQSVQPQQTPSGSDSSDKNWNWEYQALQHGWVPPTQEGRQGAPQPGAWRQPVQPQQPQQPAGWGAAQNGQQQPQQPWNGQQPPLQQDDGKFTTSRKVLWLAAGCLTGIFSLILVLIVGMGRSAQYRRQAVQWSCLGIVAAVFIDLALFAYLGVTPDLVTGMSSGSSAGSSTGSTGSAF